MTLYDWPRATAFGGVIPKSKIYRSASANSAQKGLFVREVDQVVWSHKLAPATINLVATKQVSEIQILQVASRTAELSHEVLHTIDRAIPSPLIFELAYNSHLMMIAAHKRPSEADRARWVVGDYFACDWLPEDTPRVPLPVALDMGALYEQIFGALVERQTARLLLEAGEAASFIPVSSGDQVSLEDRVAQAGAIKAKVRELKRVEARLSREKQFNKRVEINAELRIARQDLTRLAAGNSCTTMTND